MAWTDERITLLRALWTEGLSASQIAERLGGVTRNAVIGKAHRLGLSGRPSPVKTERAAAPAASSPSPRPITVVPTPPAVATQATVEADPPIRASLLTITDRMCKWPHGHPGERDFYFCGRRTNPGQSYCAEHTVRAYQTVPSRRERGHAAQG
jgi:GcrA cell cycle regulator